MTSDSRQQIVTWQRSVIWASVVFSVLVSVHLDAGAEEARHPRFPRGAEIVQLQIMRSTSRPAPSLTDFRHLMLSARPRAEESPGAGPGVFEPWCAGAFRTAAGLWRFVLFANGSGDLVHPGGSRIRFRFERSSVPDPAASPRQE